MANESDYDIKVGIDDSAFMKGFKALEKRLRGLKLPPLSVPRIPARRDPAAVPIGGGPPRTRPPRERAPIGGGPPRTRPPRERAPIGGGPPRRRSSAASDEISLKRREKMLNAVKVFERRNIDAFRNNSAEADKFANKINGVRNAIVAATRTSELDKLQNKFNLVKVGVQQTAKALRTARRDMLSLENASEGLTQSIKNLVRSYGSIFVVIEAGRAIFHAGKEMDSLRASMLAASGSAEDAADNMEFVIQSSERLGINLVAAGQGYTKIGAAAKAAGISVKDTKEIFLAASESSRTFGLNAERTNLVFLAFSQILSYEMAPCRSNMAA